MKTSPMFFKSAFVVLTILGFNSLVTAVTVQDVCVKSEFPQACAQILNSDPRHTSNDLLVFAHIAIDKATSSVTSTDKKIKSLLSQTKDPLLKGGLNKCLSLFDFAIFKCGRANDLIRARDFEGLNIVGGTVMSSGSDCHEALGRNVLIEENTQAIVIGDVIEVVANMLGGRM